MAEPIPETIPHGATHTMMTSLAGSMRNRGLDEGVILDALDAVNRKRAATPIPADELARIAHDIGNKPAGTFLVINVPTTNGHAPAPRLEFGGRAGDAQPGDGPAPVYWQLFWTEVRTGGDWLCEPLLPRGRQIAVYSPAKTGKSLLALDIAVRLATGQAALDQPAGPPINVIYLDCEMTADDLRERLEDMGYGPETDLSHLHYYLLPNLPPLDSKAGGDAVVALAEIHNADLVIVDTMSRVIAGKENDSDSIRAFYMTTALPLKAAGRTILRLDHAGKDLDRGQRGTSAKVDDVDLVWELTIRDEDQLRLRATHRRQGWVPEQVDLVRMLDPLRHIRAENSWPAGTQELAETLDRLNIPLDFGNRKVRPLLREAGHPSRNEAISAAIRYRKTQSLKLGKPPGNPWFDDSGKPSGNPTDFVPGNPLGKPGETRPQALGNGSPHVVGKPVPAQPIKVGMEVEPMLAGLSGSELPPRVYGSAWADIPRRGTGPPFVGAEAVQRFVDDSVQLAPSVEGEL